MAIESCCIPLPSEIVMPLAGVMVVSGTILAGVNPVLAIILVALAGAIGCLVGSIAAYGIGYAGGRPLMLKYGRYVLISQHDADKADSFFQRWGSATTYIWRHIRNDRRARALHAAEAATLASMAQQQAFMQNGWERQPQQPQQQQWGQSQQWGQQPPQSPQPGQQTWGQQPQPQQQSWGQPMPPSSPQQQGWGQQVPQQPPQQSFQQQGQGWGQQAPQQSPQQQQWGRVQSPQQQPPQQPSWPAQNGTNGWDGQRR